jgi:hypothetical protein
MLIESIQVYSGDGVPTPGHYEFQDYECIHPYMWNGSLPVHGTKEDKRFKNQRKHVFSLIVRCPAQDMAILDALGVLDHKGNRKGHIFEEFHMTDPTNPDLLHVFTDADVTAHFLRPDDDKEIWVNIFCSSYEPSTGWDTTPT